MRLCNAATFAAGQTGNALGWRSACWACPRNHTVGQESSQTEIGSTVRRRSLPTFGAPALLALR